MPEMTQFTIGTEATCTNGICGELSRVVVDPVARSVTHLVVEPKHRPGPPRLVPLDLVDAAAGSIRVRCTLSAFDELDAAEEVHFLPGSIGYAGYGPGQALFWPYYSGRMGVGVGMGEVSEAITYDTLPVGDVAVRRGEHVHAVDGDIGRVQGLVMDRGDRRVTHVLLQDGHLWGRKEVAIPIGNVTGVDDGIRLNITKQEVQDLPAVDIDQPNG
jgi:hypothetical protein